MHTYEVKTEILLARIFCIYLNSSVTLSYDDNLQKYSFWNSFSLNQIQLEHP